MVGGGGAPVRSGCSSYRTVCPGRTRGLFPHQNAKRSTVTACFGNAARRPCDAPPNKSLFKTDFTSTTEVKADRYRSTLEVTEQHPRSQQRRDAHHPGRRSASPPAVGAGPALEGCALRAGGSALADQPLGYFINEAIFYWNGLTQKRKHEFRIE